MPITQGLLTPLPRRTYGSNPRHRSRHHPPSLTTYVGNADHLGIAAALFDTARDILPPFIHRLLSNADHSRITTAPPMDILVESALDQRSRHLPPPSDYNGTTCLSDPPTQGCRGPFSTELFIPPFPGPKPPMAITHSSATTHQRITLSNSESLAPKQPRFRLHRLCHFHPGAPLGVPSFTVP